MKFFGQKNWKTFNAFEASQMVVVLKKVGQTCSSFLWFDCCCYLPLTELLCICFPFENSFLRSFNISTDCILLQHCRELLIHFSKIQTRYHNTLKWETLHKFQIVKTRCCSVLDCASCTVGKS